MTNYYKVQSHFYDSTRWAFLYGRKRLIEKLDIRAGERVVEIGCGTGANFRTIQDGLRNTGELIGIDCSVRITCRMIRINSRCVSEAGRSSCVSAGLRNGIRETPSAGPRWRSCRS